MKYEEQYIIESKNIKIWQLEEKIKHLEKRIKQYECVVRSITPWLASSIGDQSYKDDCFECFKVNKTKGIYDEN